MSHKDTQAHNRSFRGVWWFVAAGVLGLVLIWSVVAKPLDHSGVPSVTTTIPTTPAQPKATPSSSSPAAVVPATPKGCRVQSHKRFRPTSISIDHIGSRVVLSLGKDENGAAATPPFDEANKFGFYELGSWPGSAKGMVAFNAHTFSAEKKLGNQLLDELRADDIIIVKGANPSQRLCYHVNKSPVQYKLDSKDARHLPIFSVKRVYGFDRPSELSLTVCSDYLGGVWRTRTVWFATPITK